MDINAVQAEAANKATAWLTQNLTTDAEVAIEGKGEPASPATPPAAPPPAEGAPVVPAKPGLADAIRQNREQRQAQQTASQEAGKYKSELDAARKEIETLRALGAATDPFEFLKHRKMSKEQQAIWGQAFLYDLKPEVAPQEFRLELYKAEQARKEAEKAEADQRAEAEAAQQLQREHLDRYANEVLYHVQSNSGSCPESELWFSEEGPDGQVQVNHRVYAQSLLATADNLARRAQAQGQQADLSPANIAKVLEAEVSKRMARRDAKKGSKPADAKQVAPVIPAQGGAQATVTTTTSAEGLRSGAPLPKDMSDEARRARAAAVLAGQATK